MRHGLRSWHQWLSKIKCSMGSALKRGPLWNTLNTISSKCAKNCNLQIEHKKTRWTGGQISIDWLGKWYRIDWYNIMVVLSQVLLYVVHIRTNLIIAIFICAFIFAFMFIYLHFTTYINIYFFCKYLYLLFLFIHIFILILQKKSC